MYLLLILPVSYIRMQSKNDKNMRRKQILTAYASPKMNKNPHQKKESKKLKKKCTYEQIIVSGSNTSDIQYSSAAQSQKAANSLRAKSFQKAPMRQIRAAICIQKVFRGHLTRKLLSKYIEREEEALKNKMEYFRTSRNLEMSSITYTSYVSKCKEPSFSQRNQEDDTILSQRVQQLGNNYFKTHNESNLPSLSIFCSSEPKSEENLTTQISEETKQENYPLSKKKAPQNHLNNLSNNLSSNLSHQNEGVFKRKELSIQINKFGESNEKESLLERTQNMKNFFFKNTNLHDGHLQQLIQIREQALRRKQSGSILEIYRQLEANQLSHEQFISQLNTLSHRFTKEKLEIDQVRTTIYDGYRAQLKLMRKATLDAKTLGCNVYFSKSMEIFPHHQTWKFDSLMIDELSNHQKRDKKPIQASPQQLSFQEQDELIDFDYFEEEPAFAPRRSVMPFSFDISQLGHNSQVNSPKKETYELSDDGESHEEDEPWMKDFLEQMWLGLMWEAVEQIYTYKKSREIHRECKMTKVSHQERMGFLSCICSSMSDLSALEEKVNQQIFPTVRELLRSFHDDEVDIGQYEYLMSQDDCYTLIHDYVEKLPLSVEDPLPIEDNPYLSRPFIEQLHLLRDVQKSKKLQNEEIRRQILKIDLNVICDSFNEQFLKNRELEVGQNRIGLNQITFCLVQRRVAPIRNDAQLKQAIEDTQQRVERCFTQKKSANIEIYSEWINQAQDALECGYDIGINYAQDALECGYDIVNLIEMDLIKEIAHELHCISLKLRS